MNDEEKDEDYKWSNYGDFEHRSQTKLDGKDVLAICIASLQTIFLPFLILTAFLVVLSVVVVFFFLP